MAFWSPCHQARRSRGHARRWRGRSRARSARRSTVFSATDLSEDRTLSGGSRATPFGFFPEHVFSPLAWAARPCWISLLLAGARVGIGAVTQPVTGVPVRKTSPRSGPSLEVGFLTWGVAAQPLASGLCHLRRGALAGRRVDGQGRHGGGGDTSQFQETRGGSTRSLSLVSASPILCRMCSRSFRGLSVPIPRGL